MYRASKCNDIKKMNSFQRLLLNSISARMLAVRRVTQDNRRKRLQALMKKLILIKKERLLLVNSLDIKEKVKSLRQV
ncbi:MAG: reverse transcriptase N-terminal domain-containing protein [Wolbachia sp.]